MNILLEQRYRYDVPVPPDAVQERLSEVLHRRRRSGAIQGSLNEDGSFQLEPGSSLFGIRVFGIHQNFSLIEGRLFADGEATSIDVLLRPNYLVLFAFYALAVIGSWKILTAETGDPVLVVALLVMLLIIELGFLAAILYSRKRLLRNFENTIGWFRPDRKEEKKL